MSSEFYQTSFNASFLNCFGDFFKNSHGFHTDKPSWTPPRAPLGISQATPLEISEGMPQDISSEISPACRNYCLIS